MLIKYTVFFILLSITALQSQNRLVLKDDVFIVLKQSSKIVIDNPSDSALMNIGTDGNIVSEGENNLIKWNIDTATGNYKIPFTSKTGVKIPLVLEVDSAGIGSGSIEFSTYETSDDYNNPYPIAVNNMNSVGVDNSLMVIDRFWKIDTLGYTKNPTVNVSLTYNDAINEIGGSNTITESNLKAQRWNAQINDWEGLLFGTVDANLNKVNDIDIESEKFFPIWTLTDFSTPLPVELLSFSATCEQNKKTITWSTATEINNDYFVIEKSFDGISFEELSKIEGAGHSNEIMQYSYDDLEYTDGIVYYRLKQVDFDETQTYYSIVSTQCEIGNFEVNRLVINDNNLSFNVISDKNEKIVIVLYDYLGKALINKKTSISNGLNSFNFDYLNLSEGVYILSIKGTYNQYSIKLFNGGFR